MLLPVTMHKAAKYAVRMDTLADEARTFLMQNFGCTWKVYNLLVDSLYGALNLAGYTCGDEIPGVKIPEVSSFKKTFPYLKEVDSLGLSNTQKSFKAAWKRFISDFDHKSYTKRAIRRNESGTEPLSFRGLKGMPKFHSRAQGDFSYTTNCQYPTPDNKLKNPTVRLEGNRLFLPKLKSGIELVVHRQLPDDARIGTVTMSMDTDGKIYASVEYSYTIQMDMTIRDAVLSGDTSIVDKLKFLGLDYSQPDFYVDSEGRKANYPHYYRKAEERLAKLQKQLSHMQEGSKNYNKKLLEIQKLHKKIRNQRKDFINKEAWYLASVYDVVVVEDINLNGMGQCLHFGKNLHDNGFGMFRTQLAHKLEEKGSVLVKVDRFFASSKTCRFCGFKNPKVILGVSDWTCPSCGAKHGRDENAAINIRDEGKRIFASYFSEWMDEDDKARERAAKLLAGRRKKRKSSAS